MQKTKIQEINVHGLSVEKAITRILYAIERAYFNYDFEVRVIHGYNKGDAIKTAIRESDEIINSPYVRNVRPDLLNKGVTIIELHFQEKDYDY
jgi:hypothetical protein